MLAIECGLVTIEAANAIQAWTVLEERAAEIDAVVSDDRMPGESGRDLILKIKLRWPHLQCALLTAWLTSDLIELSAGKFEPLDKSLEPWLIAESICKLLE